MGLCVLYDDDDDDDRILCICMYVLQLDVVVEEIERMMRMMKQNRQ